MMEAERPPSPKLIDVVVRGVRVLTPRIREFVLVREDGGALPRFDAGAHIELHFDAGTEPLIRRYSLVAGLDRGDEARTSYRIAVQREERQRGSAYIHEHFRPGTRLRICYPKRDFQLDRRDGKSLLIAGGIGITPLLSMAFSLATRQRDFEIVYAGRGLSEMAYAREIHENFGPRARLHANDIEGGPLDLSDLLVAQPADTRAYVCGPAGMVQAVRDAAASLGWAPDRVRSELFGPAALASPRAFSLTLQRSGETITVGPYTSILEAMMAHGKHPLFDCGRGECGLCALPVVQADGPLQHRDVFLSPEQKARAQSMCICVSRLEGEHLTLDA